MTDRPYLIGGLSLAGLVAGVLLTTSVWDKSGVSKLVNPANHLFTRWDRVKVYTMAVSTGSGYVLLGINLKPSDDGTSNQLWKIGMTGVGVLTSLAAMRVVWHVMAHNPVSWLKTNIGLVVVQSFLSCGIAGPILPAMVIQHQRDSLQRTFNQELKALGPGAVPANVLARLAPRMDKEKLVSLLDHCDQAQLLAILPHVGKNDLNRVDPDLLLDGLPYTLLAEVYPQLSKAGRETLSPAQRASLDELQRLRAMTPDELRTALASPAYRVTVQRDPDFLTLLEEICKGPEFTEALLPLRLAAAGIDLAKKAKDLEIVIQWGLESRTISCNKEIMTGGSDVIKGMASGGFAETGKAQITFPLDNGEDADQMARALEMIANHERPTLRALCDVGSAIASLQSPRLIDLFHLRVLQEGGWQDQDELIELLYQFGQQERPLPENVAQHWAGVAISEENWRLALIYGTLYQSDDTSSTSPHAKAKAWFDAHRAEAPRLIGQLWQVADKLESEDLKVHAKGLILTNPELAYTIWNLADIPEDIAEILPTT